MATATNNRSLCDACGKAKGISKCEGCLKIFCYNHFGDHRQQLNTQLDDIEVSRDIFRQTLTEQTTEPHKHALIQQINKWERDSIEKIQQTANEAREMLLMHATKHISEIEIKLNKLTNHLRESRHENDFVETDLRQWKGQLTQLTKELATPSYITLQEDSKPLVTKIYVSVSAASSLAMKIDANTQWKENGITIAGGNGRGDELNQLSDPWGLYIDDDNDRTIYIADTSNHRVVQWKYNGTSGQIVAGGRGAGNRIDQLNKPRDVIFDKKSNSFIISDAGNCRVMQWFRGNSVNRKILISNVSCYGLAMDKDGYLYVPDCEKHEVRRWKIGETSGTVVAGGNGQGSALNQLNGPIFICVDGEYSVYISDHNNHRVMKWMKGAKEGIVIAGGQGQGNNSIQLSSPRGVIVDQLGTVYVADSDNHRVMRWCKGAKQGSIVVGGSSQGGRQNQLYCPQDLSFDRRGNLYVVDFFNFRVWKFDIS